MAALAGQVLAVGEEAGGPAALQRQPGVDEGGGAAVVVHKERLRNRRNMAFGTLASSVEGYIYS